MKAGYISIIILYLIILSISGIKGQTISTIDHYYVEDGLSHNLINDIIQDKKGFIWMATYNGLCKFDGYSFKQYLYQPSDSIYTKNNRIDKITEDIYGRIWIQSSLFKPKVSCFNPITEKFWGKDFIDKKSLSEFQVSKIIPTKSGLVWLLSDTCGCICIQGENFNLTELNKNNHKLKASCVHNILEDKEQNTWLLTNNGIIQYPNNDFNKKKNFFSDETKNSTEFFSSIEFDDEIWFGGASGIIAIYSKSEHTFRVLKLPFDRNIFDLFSLQNHKILAVSNKDGFCTIQRYSNNIQLYNSKNHPEINTNNLHAVAVSNENLFWFDNDKEDGISSFNFETNKYTFFKPHKNKTVHTKKKTNSLVLTNNKGETWIQPKGGGFSYYNKNTNKLIIVHPNQKDNSLMTFSNNFHIALFDKQDNLWFNNYAAGLGKIVFCKNNFKTLDIKKLINDSVNYDIRSIYQLKDSTIWISSKKNQILILDKNLHKIGFLSKKGNLRNYAYWPKSAYHFLEDSKGIMWIATRGDGIYQLTPGNKKYNYAVKHFKNESGNRLSLCDNDVYSIYEDSHHRIWIGTLGGLDLVTNDNNEIRFTNINEQLKITSTLGKQRIRCINETPDGLICVGTMEGLFLLNPENKKDNGYKWRFYEHEINDEKSLLCNDIIDFCITTQKDVFIATAYGGISKIDSIDKEGFPVSFTTYTKKNGLPSNNILSLEEDQDGKIWIAMDYQLCRFDPSKELFEVFPEIKTQMQWKNFSEATRERLISGEILLGYSGGIVYFNPDQIITNLYAPYLALTNLNITNQKEGNNIQVSLATYTNKDKPVILPHNENFFNISFVALDYESSSNIKYAYKLEGLDNFWNYVGNQRSANYTNVPKGNYIFVVKSTNSQGVWSDKQTKLNISILPSFWETTWAYFIYALIILIFLLVINYNIITIYKLKANIKLEKKMSGLKQKFFVDISHEIRTPLTMITAPIEYLIEDNRTPETVKNQLRYVEQSSGRLLRLVNQILDFRKVQELKLKVCEIEIGPFVKEICNDFIEIAKEQDISFSFINNTTGNKIWADKNSLEKIIMNLLSNAFKYTPNGKSITVIIEKQDRFINLKIEDKGIGIQKNILNKLFTRFVSFSQNENQPSTGIGLSIVKEEVEKHKAKIFVQSEPGKGSIFFVQFKTGKDHFPKNTEFITTNNLAQNPEPRTLKSTNKTMTDKKASVLIIEDDKELRIFMNTILEQQYNVILAEDGEIGFQMATTQSPDFIVSDIMMPKVNGIELLKMIRDDLRTSHIPTILLTAKTNIESKLEGLTYGADDYITKPFSVPYFKTRIENLLNQRKRLHDIFTKRENKEYKDYSPKPCLITNQDEEIMEKIMLIIEQNIDNSDFSVENLTTEIGLNRTTMFYKIKSLTGQSPVEFIRDIRLKRAAQLIKESQLLIKEIAFMTGFQDIKYFGKCFKKKFEMTPMEYRKNHLK